MLYDFRMGLVVLSLGGIALACQSTPQRRPGSKPAMASGHEHEGEEHSIETLSVEKRVAFMSGHVEAGFALYRAKAPDQASQHLLHPVSETHQAERKGIDALGFKAAVFEAVSKALQEGRAAAEIEPMLKECEENMALMQKSAGGDSREIIAYLMDTVEEEYAIGVKAGAITDPGEYQDAYGFTVVAHKIAKSINGAEKLVGAIEALYATWPKGGPLANSTPAKVEDVLALTKKVKDALLKLP